MGTHGSHTMAPTLGEQLHMHLPLEARVHSSQRDAHSTRHEHDWSMMPSNSVTWERWQKRHTGVSLVPASVASSRCREKG